MNFRKLESFSISPKGLSCRESTVDSPSKITTFTPGNFPYSKTQEGTVNLDVKRFHIRLLFETDRWICFLLPRCTQTAIVKHSFKTTEKVKVVFNINYISYFSVPKS